jgi:phenylpyruvate tautomerase PptA (4-oxalocrotonate tautomerase family)
MPVVRVSWFQSIETTAKKAFAKEITESMVRNFNFRRRNIQKVLAGFLRV